MGRVQWTSIIGTRPAYRQSLAITLGYYFFYAGVGAFTPYTALYYRHLGVSGLELGILTSLPALGTSLTAPLWGVCADKLSAHRQMMRTVLVVAAVVSLALTQVTTFAPFLVLLGLLAFAMVPVASLWDSYGVTSVERGGAPYGVMRLGGSLGFISMVVTMGILMSGGMTNRFIWAYALIHVLTMLTTFGLPQLGERRERQLSEGLKHILRQRSFLLLLAVAYLVGSSVCTINLYLGLHLQSLGEPTTKLGVAFAISATSELPIIGFGTYILRRVGAYRMIAFALCVYVIRFMLLGFAPDERLIFAAQCLHGLSFGMFLVASVNQAHRLVGVEHAATAQALLTTMSFGLGIVTGAIGGGMLLDAIGTSNLYKCVAGVLFTALIVHVTGHRLLERRVLRADMPIG